MKAKYPNHSVIISKETKETERLNLKRKKKLVGYQYQQINLFTNGYSAVHFLLFLPLPLDHFI